MQYKLKKYNKNSYKYNIFFNFNEILTVHKRNIF